MLCNVRHFGVGRVATYSVRSRGRYSGLSGAVRLLGRGLPVGALAASTGSPAVSCSTTDRS